ncbi:MAG: right-handed parallel beta-helix repeat-containing protein [Actinomycetota bacterium]|nr:right-handed parallel beta-helix repeat-containing protein [Actinomycetota bacterium]
MAGWLLAARSPSAQSASVSCSLYASPTGSDSSGTASQSSPFQTAQRLSNALAPGQTGCLMTGAYSDSPGLTLGHGGSAGEPITLSSAPGQTATLEGGYVYMPTGSDYVTLENLVINGSGTRQNSIQIFGSHDSLIGDEITNGEQHNSCIIVGASGYTPYPTDTLIEGNVIHKCGNAADGNKDQGIYLSQSVHATVTNNIIWGSAAFGLQLYPDAVGTTITHNVIADNGYGVIFAGNAGAESTVSDGNRVEGNIVVDSTVGYNVSSSGDASATSNVFNDNCTYNTSPVGGDISNDGGFTTSGNISGSSPLFVDGSAHTVEGYELRSGSPCLSVVGYDTAALLLRVGSAVA